MSTCLHFSCTSHFVWNVLCTQKVHHKWGLDRGSITIAPLFAFGCSKYLFPRTSDQETQDKDLYHGRNVPSVSFPTKYVCREALIADRKSRSGPVHDILASIFAATNASQLTWCHNNVTARRSNEKFKTASRYRLGRAHTLKLFARRNKNLVGRYEAPMLCRAPRRLNSSYFRQPKLPRRLQCHLGREP